MNVTRFRRRRSPNGSTNTWKRYVHGEYPTRRPCHLTFFCSHNPVLEFDRLNAIPQRPSLNNDLRMDMFCYDFWLLRSLNLHSRYIRQHHWHTVIDTSALFVSIHQFYSFVLGCQMCHKGCNVNSRKMQNAHSPSSLCLFKSRARILELLSDIVVFVDIIAQDRLQPVNIVPVPGASLVIVSSRLCDSDAASR